MNWDDGKRTLTKDYMVFLARWARRFSFFFFQAEDGIRDADVTGVQTCALPICGRSSLTCGISRAPWSHSAGGREDRDRLSLPCRRLPRRLRRLLLVLVPDLVETDIDDVSIEFRPRWHRER